MPDSTDELNPHWRTFTWNYGIPRWISFGIVGRVAWLAKGEEIPVTGTWHKIVGRLYFSDKRPWVAALKRLDEAAIANPE